MSTGKSQGHHKLPFQIDLCPIKGYLASVILPTALLSKPKTGNSHVFLFSHLVMSKLSLRRQICHAFLPIVTATAQSLYHLIFYNSLHQSPYLSLQSTLPASISVSQDKNLNSHHTPEICQYATTQVSFPSPLGSCLSVQPLTLYTSCLNCPQTPCGFHLFLPALHHHLCRGCAIGCNILRLLGWRFLT